LSLSVCLLTAYLKGHHHCITMGTWRRWWFKSL